MESIVPVPAGFSFAAHASGMRYQGRDDLALIVSDRPAVGAGVFTKNLFQAAPVTVARENIKNSQSIRAFLVNAGQANACTGDEGLANCRATLEMMAERLGIEPGEILPASTGVIGPQLKMDLWRAEAPALAAGLGKAAPLDAAKAIMTTDAFPKMAWGFVETPSGTVRLLGMAKGAGMICPNMATMLGFVLCDADVEKARWQAMLAAAVDASFNAVTVDGDTSTNDCVLAMANGASGVAVREDDELSALAAALNELCQALAYMIVEDAEGGTKIVRVHVTGAQDHMEAEACARAVGHSPLVKTAMFGRDANWGRIVAAVGRSGAEFDPAKVSVAIGGIPVFQNGQPVPGDLDSLLAPHMRRAEIAIDIDLGAGEGEYLLLASDLGFDYVKCNASYRS
ncbi:Arginine biosynthesis bifunctional protein ArgJ [Fundidesulfovibrio magnetotacticus]|uniref:Arginine biosynthesis bifunctional protein ArgJ n=2 Tax=Fundidesulfovibrio magnetotacticus TaxID=2730080 RepID=A0A6V8LVV1_9BACT|nr:Arginine biosynthesis bifunctional protein ArgJ [Fundidesulfovibrio magnetotacticus]